MSNAHAPERQRSWKGTNLRDSKGVYTWKDERFTSVTTILKEKNMPALPRWASKSVAEHVAGKAQEIALYLPSVVKNRIPWREVQEHLQESLAELQDVETLKQVPWVYSEKKRDIGSIFHDIAEAITFGTPVSPEVFSEDIRGYVNSFITWLRESQVRYYASEVAVFSRKHGYAGTLDSLVSLNPDMPLETIAEQGLLDILDYKTSQDSYEDHALQLAAYRHAEFIGIAETGEEIPMPETRGGMILVVGHEKCRPLRWNCGEDEFKAFLGLLDVRRWTETKPKYKTL